MSVFDTRWDFPQDYVDRIGAAAEAHDVDATMALHQEAFAHGDFLAYTFAFRQWLEQRAMVRIVKAEHNSLTWDDVRGETIFEPILWPKLLYLAHCHDVLKNDDEYREALADTWTAAEWPEQYMDTDLWVDYFTDAGFITDEGQPAERPDQPMVLWRGATVDRKFGMAWTDQPHTANWFAKRFAGSLGEKDQPVKVFRCVVPPDVLLAHFEGRGEHEWVVDPYFLEEDESAEIEEFELNSLPEFAKPEATDTVSSGQQSGERS